MKCKTHLLRRILTRKLSLKSRSKIMKNLMRIPGHRTICSARVNLEINSKRNHTKYVKAKLDSCESISTAHSNQLNEIKPAGKYNLPPIRLRGIGGKTNLLNKVD